MLQGQQNIHPVFHLLQPFFVPLYFTFTLQLSTDLFLLASLPTGHHFLILHHWHGAVSQLQHGQFQSTLWPASLRMLLTTFRSRPSPSLVATYICYIAQGVWDHLYLAPEH